MNHPQPPSTSITLIGRLHSAEDAEAWRTFVDLYTPVIYGYCCRRGLQEADARDVTQDVFSQVSQALRVREYDAARGRFRNWLGAITHHSLIRHQKKLRRPGQGSGSDDELDRLLHVEGDVDPAWLEEFNVQILQAALRRIRAEFDEATWRVFELTWLGDRATEEVTQLLARPAAWIYKARSRVLSRLREEVRYLAADVAFFVKD